MRAFGKDRARETKAPARSILAAVPTPLGPPVGCHPTPSDGIAHANHRTVISTGKGLIYIFLDVLKIATSRQEQDPEDAPSRRARGRA